MKARFRSGPSVAAALILAAGLGFAASAPAHPHDPHGKAEKIERVIVLAGDADGKEHKRRMRTVHGHGPHGHIECDRERTDMSEETGEGRERTLVLLCGKDLNSAAHAEKLERALSHIQSNDRISPEHRERIASRLRETIDRLRSRANED
jgi:hypothetical protein